jgi:hypothetical protein
MISNLIQMRRPKQRWIGAIVVSFCTASFVVVVSTQCGGKRSPDEAGIDAEAEEGSSTDARNYCTWVAYDGTQVICAVGDYMCKAPPGIDWCNWCGCADPVKNIHPCHFFPCSEPP